MTPTARIARRLKDAKAKGARRERQARKQLEAEGYSVTRAAGSMGAWDLVAIMHQYGEGELVRLVQVKSNLRPCPKERMKLGHDIAQYDTAVRGEVWVYRDRVALPDIYTVLTSGELEPLWS